MSLESVFTVSLPAGPYPGLRPFEQDEWPIFFGRERMADAVIAQLIAKHVLVVHGDSGCGKSSLVRAAVLPRLEQENARSGIRWRTCTALPREAPLWNLAVALAGLDGGARNEDRIIEMRRALNCGTDAPQAIAELLPRAAGDQVCILIDQFEELFAHAGRHGPDEARLLTQFLSALFEKPEHGFYAVLTMRSEFLGACARYAGFAELVNATQYLLPRMDALDLRRAICESAKLFDGQVSSELADRLIADAGGGQDQLPLIQHGLMLLHRAQASSGPWHLGLEHYRHEGGLAGLLSDHADEVERASGAPPGVVEALFRELTEINAEGQAIRRPRTLAQLIAASGADEVAVRAVIDAFRADGVSFLKPYGTEALATSDLIDISHEALIRCWRRLGDPKDGWLLREFRNGLIWRALLVQAESFERDPSSVLGPVTTDERERWLAGRTEAWSERYGGGWQRVTALIAASAAARDRDRAEHEETRRREEKAKLRKLQVRVLSVLVILSVASSIIGVLLWRSARREAHEARLQFDRLQTETSRREALQSETASSATQIKELVKQLDSAVERGTSESALAQSVRSVTGVLTKQADNLAYAADKSSSSNNVPPPSPLPGGPPRVYIQIASETQRGPARDFEHMLEASAPGQIKVVVPGIELVKVATSGSVLRCFKADECAADGPGLVARMNALLRTPQIVLEDQSARYGSAANIRPRQFELWFADGEIALQGR